MEALGLRYDFEMGHPAAMPPAGFEQMPPEEQPEYLQELLKRATIEEGSS